MLENKDYAPQCAEMIENQLRRRGISDAAVLAAMTAVPRHEFVPPELRSQAYDDLPLPIGGGQTISQPYMVAAMTPDRMSTRLNSSHSQISYAVFCLKKNNQSTRCSLQ